MQRPHPHKQQHHAEQHSTRDGGNGSSSSSTHGADLGTRNGLRGGNRDGQGYSGAGGTEGGSGLGEPDSGAFSGHGMVQSQLVQVFTFAAPSAAGVGGDKPGGPEGQSQQQQSQGTGQQSEASRQWPGLVDYDDDDDAAIGQQSDQGVSAQPSPLQQGNGPDHSGRAGRSLDLGRRPRSEMEDSKAGRREEGSDRVNGQDPRKRLRNDDTGKYSGST